MKEILLEDMKQAMRDKDTITKNCIQMLRAEILNEEKSKQVELTDSDIFKIIQKQIKQKHKAVEDFKKGNREDLVLQTEREIQILEGYLPLQLSPEELAEGIRKIITEFKIDITNNSSFGQLMKISKERLDNVANGSDISNCIKKLMKGE